MVDDQHYLMYMSQCVGRILKYAEGGRSEFLGSPIIQDAVMWNLALVGNAAKNVSAEQKQTYPQVDWARMSRICAELLSDPWACDREKVWRCVEQDLPELRQELRGILVASHVK